ncbi:hypothetical protein DFH29DRAFT_879425 [Suillus ampliporus]|nr:hypothetical protein DFH29DRAFT_879425 [Suillus ampliporus]
MSWMTHEQADFLKSKVDGFCLSQLQGEVAAYCTNTYREWFEKWPEVAAHFKDDAGITLMESQLTNDQMKELANMFLFVPGRVTQFTKTITKIMGTTTNRTRGPSAVKHYIQTEYKANPEVKAEIVTQMKNNSNKPHISILRSEAAKSMAAHGKEFIHHMEAEAKIECARHADQAKADLEAIHTPTESLKTQCLEGLGGVIGQLLDAIHETTGWHGSVYLGGPDPRVNGEVRVFSFHHGKGFSGFNFRETLPDHHGHIVEPFTAFLKGAFNLSVTPLVGESLVNETSASIGCNITVVNASHPSTNSTVTPPARESSPSASIGPKITTLAMSHNSASTLQGPKCDVKLLDGIHPTPPVPLLDPSLSLEHLLSLDPELMDFSQVDLDSFNLPTFPSLPPSPDSPISCWNRDAALDFISPPCFRRIESKSPDNPQPLHALQLLSTLVPPSVSTEADSQLPATLMDPEPVTSMETSAITSVDSAPLTPSTPLMPSADALVPAITSDIMNQSRCHSTRSHVPSTHLEEANHIDSNTRARTKCIASSNVSKVIHILDILKQRKLRTDTGMKNPAGYS